MLYTGLQVVFGSQARKQSAEQKRMGLRGYGRRNEERNLQIKLETGFLRGMLAFLGGRGEGTRGVSVGVCWLAGFVVCFLFVCFVPRPRPYQRGHNV